MTRLHPSGLLFLSLTLSAAACGQTAATRATVQKTPQAATPAKPVMPVNDGQEIDRIVAIVGSDLILDSDVNEEERFMELQPFQPGRGDQSRNRVIERLINRELILQQAKLTPMEPITNDEVQKNLDDLKKTIPACKQFHCETKAGYDAFLAAHGFTEETIQDRWRQRMEVLRFIEERFRMGVRISDEDVKTYYEKTMLPEYEKQHQVAPKLAVLEDRIREVLLQQQVSTLLADWLKSLRAQGSVVVLKKGEVAP